MGELFGIFVYGIDNRLFNGVKRKNSKVQAHRQLIKTLDIMAKVKFGTQQIDNPTPARLNLWVRVFTIAGGIFMAWMATASIMGPNAKDVVNQVLGLALGLANGLAPLFGVPVTGKVDAEDVTAIDSSKV